MPKRITTPVRPDREADDRLLLGLYQTISKARNFQRDPTDVPALPLSVRSAIVSLRKALEVYNLDCAHCVEDAFYRQRRNA